MKLPPTPYPTMKPGILSHMALLARLLSRFSGSNVQAHPNGTTAWHDPDAVEKLEPRTMATRQMTPEQIRERNKVLTCASPQLAASNPARPYTLITRTSLPGPV